MDFLTALEISATGLSAQRTRMNIISSNLANVNTTRTPAGTPYRRRDVVMEPKAIDSFDTFLNAQAEDLEGVEVSDIVEDTTPFRMVYDPGHPDADAAGNVWFPNVNAITEMANMVAARRSYEANATAIAAVKRMALKALEIGK